MQEKVLNQFFRAFYQFKTNLDIKNLKKLKNIPNLKELSHIKSIIVEIIVNSIITTLIISFPKRKSENELEVNVSPSNIIFLTGIFAFFFLILKSKNLLLLIGIVALISTFLSGLIIFWLRNIEKSIKEKIGVIKSYRFIIHLHIFYSIFGIILGIISIIFFFLKFFFPNIPFAKHSYILLSFSIILLGINKFFYSMVLNALERFLLPSVQIIYFATKNELIDIKRSNIVNERFSASLIENYRGYLLIPWNVRDKFRNPYMENVKEENFYEYMLKRLVRYFINIRNREASYKYTPLFIVYIFNIFIPIFVFIGLLGFMSILEEHLNSKPLVVMYVSLFFVIWYLFFLRIFLLMLPSNVLQILSKYIYKNLVDNIHLIIKKPAGVTEEINIYEVLNKADFSKQDLENINQIFQIVVVIILTLSIAGFISYK
jgi:hypothetical protein